MRRALTWLLRLVGVGMLVVYVVRSDPTAILAAMRRCDLAWIFLALVLQTGMLVLKAARWWLVLASYGIPRPLGETTRVFLAGYFLGVVTPGRAGELIRLSLCTGRSQTPRCLLSLVVDRALDAAFLLIVSFMALDWLGAIPRLASILACCAVGLGLVVLIDGRPLALVSRFIGKYLRRLDFIGPHGGQERSSASLGAWSVILGITVVSDGALFIGSVACVSAAFGLAAPLWLIAAGVALNATVNILPITIGGIGTREAVFLQLLGGIGIGAETTIAFTTAVFVTVVLLPAMGCLPFFLSLRRHQAGRQAAIPEGASD